MKPEEKHRLNEVTTPCETTEIKPLGPKGTRGEFFLKLEKRLNFPKYHMHIMVDREGRKVMFYNCKGVAFNEGDWSYRSHNSLLNTITLSNGTVNILD